MSQTAPKVSVIIPNYNHARFLPQRIESVLGQTYRDFEVILLDDCSTDESRTIISECAADPRVRIEFNEKNSGSTFEQWNKGIRLARGDYIWVAESDDYADQRFLETMVSLIGSDPTITLCNCRSWVVSSDGEITRHLDSHLARLDAKKWTEDFCVDGREECRKYLVRCCTVLNASSVVFRKDVYERVGGADNTMRQCGDWKLWAAMALEGKIAHVGGTPLNYYREHDSSVTVDNLRMAVYESEYLQVTRWICERVQPAKATLEAVRRDTFELWYPKVLTNRVPFKRRWQILRNAMAIDPKALRKLVLPALVALRMTLSRRYQLLRFRLSNVGRVR